jgi:hypothetical protein
MDDGAEFTDRLEDHDLDEDEIEDDGHAGTGPEKMNWQMSRRLLNYCVSVSIDPSGEATRERETSRRN